MIPALQEPYDALEERRNRILARLGELSKSQRSFRPRAAAWSPLEVAHHVVLVEQLGVEAFERYRGQGSARRSLKQWLGYLVVWLVLTFGLRFKNPAEEAAPDRSVSLQQIESEWEGLRNRLKARLEELDERDLRQAAGKHPIAGPLNLKEALALLVRHLDHHLRQLNRIRQAPSFPAE